MNLEQVNSFPANMAKEFLKFPKSSDVHIVLLINLL